MGEAGTDDQRPVDLRAAIIRTSLDLGAEYGEEGLTMRGIAGRLGVSPTALYHHFDGKAAILQAIRLDGMRQLTIATLEAFALEDHRECLLRASRAYVSFARDNRWLYRLLFEDNGPGEVFTNEQMQLVRGSQEDIRMQAIARFRSLAGGDGRRLSHFLARWWSGLHGLSSLIIHERLEKVDAVLRLPDLDAFIEDYLNRHIDSLLGDAAEP